MNTLHRSMFATMLLAACVLMATPRRAGAQVTTNCCTFNLFVSFAFPCGVPVSIKTSWSGAIQGDNVNVQGTLVQKNIAGCPPAPKTLDSISVDGITWFTPGPTLPSVSAPINACGGCYRIGVSLNPTTNCLDIRLTGC